MYDCPSDYDPLHLVAEAERQAGIEFTSRHVNPRDRQEISALLMHELLNLAQKPACE